MLRKIPLFWLSLAFLLGIVLAGFLPWKPEFWKIIFWVCLGFLLVECVCRRKWTILAKPGLPVFLLLMTLVGGGWRMTTVEQKPFTENDLAFYNDKGNLSLQGVVCSDPQHNEKSIRFTLCVEQLLKPETKILRGKVLVVQRMGDWKYGDRLLIHGFLNTPEENEEFSYKDYLAQRGIHSLMNYPRVEFVEAAQGGWLKTALFRLRQTAYQRIQDFLPQPEAGLLSGILLGIESDIPYELEKAFQDTGTAHVVAISGFNMAILAGIFLKSFRKYLSIWWAAVLAIVVISLYAVLVGGAPAVVRAAVMSCLAMSASLIGRGQSGTYTLVLTAVVMCSGNPLLVQDAGFQLSVTATLGLVLYAERLMVWFRSLAGKYLPDPVVERITGPVGDYLLFTLAAQVMTLPVVLYHFEQLSLTTLIANPLILPVQPLVMILGGVAVLVGMLFPPLGQLLAWVVWVPLSYTIRVVSALADISGGVLELGEISLISVLAMYLVIFFLTFKKKDQELKGIRKQILLTAVLVAAVFLVWNAVLLKPDGKLHLWILDDPDAGVVLVQTPAGKRILVNAGESANSLSSEIMQHLPVLNRRLDLALLTHPDAKTYSGYSTILERFQVQQFLWGEEIPDTFTARSVLEALQEHQIKSQILKAGQRVDCGDGVLLEKYALEKTGISFLLTYADFRFFLVEEEVHADDNLQLIDGAVLLVRPGQEVEEMELTWQPQVIIHHEYQPEDVPGQISTQKTGRIEIIADGKQMWMLGEKR